MHTKRREGRVGFLWLESFQQCASRLYDASECDGEHRGLLQTDSSVRPLIKQQCEQRTCLIQPCLVFMGWTAIQEFTLRGHQGRRSRIPKSSLASFHITLGNTTDCVFNCFDYQVYLDSIENGNATQISRLIHYEKEFCCEPLVTL